jgi:NAD(P)-dependent dehydrogenase (short-subunit alcohol dehydrogenase family)
MSRTRIALGALGLALGGLWLAVRPRRISFEERVVVITGGSRGLGLVMARQLIDEGAHLVLLARSKPELEYARRQLERRRARRRGSNELLTIACDVGEYDDVAAAFEQIFEYFGRVDVLINNAGVIQVGPAEHMRFEDFDDSLAVHFWGPLYAVRQVLPHMRRRGEGRIVNIASIGGKVVVPHLLPYCVGKHALVGLSEGLRQEFRKDGVLVTTVCPGLMRTGSPPHAQVKGQRDKEYAWFAIGDSLPVLAIDAERAARKILRACRHGRAQLTITPQARMLSLANELTPGLYSLINETVNRLLPAAVGRDGDSNEPAHQHESAATRSFLTVLGRQAAARNNEGLRAVDNPAA